MNLDGFRKIDSMQMRSSRAKRETEYVRGIEAFTRFL